MLNYRCTAPEFRNKSFSALVRIYAPNNVVGEFLGEDVVAVRHGLHFEAAILVLLDRKSHDDGRQRVDLIRKRPNDARCQILSGF